MGVAKKEVSYILVHMALIKSGAGLVDLDVGSRTGVSGVANEVGIRGTKRKMMSESPTLKPPPGTPEPPNPSFLDKMGASSTGGFWKVFPALGVLSFWDTTHLIVNTNTFLPVIVVQD